MRPRILAALALTAAALVAAPASAAAQSSRHYVFVRVDTGQPGSIATDADLNGYAKAVARFWASIPGAPKVTVTVDHRLLHGTPAPSCGFTVGRTALDAAGTPAPVTDGVVTFLRQGYPCLHYTAHGDQPGLDVEAFGGTPWVTWREVAHEIGHNLGVQHDRTTGFLLPETLEYGNPYSVMGSGDGPPAMWQAARLGWDRLYALPTGRVGTVYPRTDPRPEAVRGRTFISGGVTYSVEVRPGTDLAPAGVAVYRSIPAGDCQWYATARPGHPVRAGSSLIRVVVVRHGYWAIQRT
jgi:hypothetical protein